MAVWSCRPIMRLLIDRVETPIGILLLAADSEGRLRAMDWADYEERMQRLLRRHYGTRYILEAADDPHGLSEKMRRYFKGDIGVIEDIAVETAGTVFQQQVWAELRKIASGSVISYGQLAERIGNPKAVRAVGLANGSNPIGIVVPCHRVIGADGSLTGYGGGLERKKWLLDHEKQHAFPLALRAVH